jgi:hypothetical protein
MLSGGEEQSYLSSFSESLEFENKEKKPNNVNKNLNILF